MTPLDALKEKQKRHEARAAAAERLLVGGAITRRLFRSKHFSIIVSDISGNILDATPAAEMLFGRGLEELKHVGWTKLTHPDDLAFDQAFARRCESGEITGYTLIKRYLSKDGTDIPVHMQIMKINGGEIPTGIYVCIINRLHHPVEEAELVDISPTGNPCDAE